MSAKTIICKNCLQVLHPMKGNTDVIDGYLVCAKCRDPKGLEAIDNFIVNDFLEQT